MKHIHSLVEELRTRYEVLREDRLPINVFTFFEIDLGLDAIPFDDLTAKYRVEAALLADFSGLYLDAEQYNLMEKGPDWKLNRLRFTIAHELAHYFLHRDIARKKHFSTLAAFNAWNANYGGNKYEIEQEANEFAGCLLVPEKRLREHFEKFGANISKVLPNFMMNAALRDKFSEQIAPRFGVNAQVIAIRLDRDGIWPAC